MVLVVGDLVEPGDLCLCALLTPSRFNCSTRAEPSLIVSPARCLFSARCRTSRATQKMLPMQPGFPERRTHDYLRHGTTTLFATLEVAPGR
jgi:hypothetical protein